MSLLRLPSAAGGLRSIAGASLFALLLAVSVPAAGQVESGSLYGAVTGPDGAPLAGVAVALTGEHLSLEERSDADGNFRFLGLAPGDYELEATHDGYVPALYRPVVILVGRPTTARIRMSTVPGETIVVTAEPPLTTAEQARPGITVTSFELDRIPTSRDPWSVAAQAPGVLATGVNVGGSESRLQLGLVGPGSRLEDNAYAVDGVVITDMAAVGGSPLYYDLDQLEQVEIVLGGADPSIGSSGVTINMITKRGSNEWRGSARYLATDGDLLAEPNFDAASLPLGQDSAPPAGVESVDEYGAEGGGRLIEDRLWAWGSFGLLEVRAPTLYGTTDRTELENSALKLHGRPTAGNSAMVSARLSEKRRDGLGASPFRAPETLWNQHGPIDFVILEDSQAIGSSVYLSAQAAMVDTGFHLTPHGGSDAEPVLGPDGVFRGTYVAITEDRDVRQAKLEGAGLLPGDLSQELRFGASFRRFLYAYGQSWGPRNLLHIAKENRGTELDLVEAMRPARFRSTQDYGAAWLQDRVWTERLTIDVGLRFDSQEGETAPLRVAANPAFPEILPALEVPGSTAGFSWESWSPRVGVAWAPSEEARTLVHASLARYPSQVHTGLIDRTQPVTGASALLGYEDTNGNGLYDDGEPTSLLSVQGVDPGAGSLLTDPDLTDAHLGPELIDELRLGAHRDLRADLVVGLTLSYRRLSQLLETRPLVRDDGGRVRVATREDYELDRVLAGQLPDGGTYQAPVYTLDPQLQYTGGRLLTNGDREQEYLGASLEVNKRLSDRWMLRGHLTVSDWRWRIGREFARHDDPTDAAPSLDHEWISDAADTPDDVVAEQALRYGGKSGTFLNSGWSFNLTGYYQVAPERPWGFNVAGNVGGREGYPAPYRVRATPADGLTRSVQVTGESDTFRFPDLYTFDLRVEKEWTIGDFATVAGLDVFNVFNEGYVLQRDLRLDGPGSGYVLETLGPRVLRMGLRLSWR